MPTWDLVKKGHRRLSWANLLAQTTFCLFNQQTNHCVLPVKWRSSDYSAVHRLRSNFVWEHKSHTLPLPPHCKEVQWKARQHSLCIPYNLNFSRGKQILDSTGYLDKKGKLLQLLFFPFSNQFIYFMLGEILKRIPGILCVKKLKYNHGFWKCLLVLLCAFEYFISPLSTIFYGSTSCPLIKFLSIWILSHRYTTPCL